MDGEVRLMNFDREVVKLTVSCDVKADHCLLRHKLVDRDVVKLPVYCDVKAEACLLRQKLANPCSTGLSISRLARLSFL